MSYSLTELIRLSKAAKKRSHLMQLPSSSQQAIV